MNSSQALSIIIPAYNAERWIVPCVESALGSYSGEKEVICVDDGSTDSTLSLIEGLAASNPEVKCIHQANRGRCVARNVGLDHSTGDWVTFLDADDMMVPMALDKTLSSIDDEVSMFCTLGINREKGNINFRTPSQGEASHIIVSSDRGLAFLLDREYEIRHGKEFIKNASVFEQYSTMWCSTVFTKVFRRRDITSNDVRFVPGLKFGEDVLFIYDYATRVKGQIDFYPIITHVYNSESEGTIRGYKVGDLSLLDKTICEWATRREGSKYHSGIASCCMRNCLFTSVRAAQNLSKSMLTREMDGFLGSPWLKEAVRGYRTESIAPRSTLAPFWKLAARSLVSENNKRYKCSIYILGIINQIKIKTIKCWDR